MRHNKENEKPHQPEMPYTRGVKASKERSQPMKLHRLMNRPACGNRKKPGNRNREICRALERVVLGAEPGMRPFTARQLSEGNAQVISKHPERVKLIRPARQQAAPTLSHDKP